MVYLVKFPFSEFSAGGSVRRTSLLKYHDKKVKPKNLWNILPQGQGTFVPSLYQKRTVLCSKASLRRISRTLKQHYLIPMMRDLGSIITIHKTFPHLGTTGKSCTWSCKGNLNFFSKTILETKQKTVIGGLTMQFSQISVMEIITV